MATNRPGPMLGNEELQSFGRDGYLVVPAFVAEPLLAELEAEADALIAAKPAPEDKVGFHHYFEHPADLPVADRILRESGVLDLAAELVAPHAIDLAFDLIQVATSIPGWDHHPGGGHLDGYGIEGESEPHTFTLLAGIYLGDERRPDRGNIWVWPGSHLGHERLFRERGFEVLMDSASAGGHACLLDPAPDLGRGQPVLAGRGDVLLAHYLLAHNQSGNLGDRLRRIVYYRLAADGHRSRWADTQTDALLEFAPVRSAQDRTT